MINMCMCIYACIPSYSFYSSKEPGQNWYQKMGCYFLDNVGFVCLFVCGGNCGKILQLCTGKDIEFSKLCELL